MAAGWRGRQFFEFDANVLVVAVFQSVLRCGPSGRLPRQEIRHPRPQLRPVRNASAHANEYANETELKDVVRLQCQQVDDTGREGREAPELAAAVNYESATFHEGTTLSSSLSVVGRVNSLISDLCVECNSDTDHGTS